MKKAWKGIRVLIGVAGWGVLLVCGAVLAVIGIGPHFANYRTLSVLSGSMQPGIPTGAVVIVTAGSPRDVKVGQIITYKIPVDDQRVVSHRVVEIVEGEGTDTPVIRTKGDANDAPDPWLAKISSPTVWEVRYSVPGVGRAIYLLRNPAVQTGAVRVVPLVLALLWIISIWRGDSDESNSSSPALKATATANG